MGKFNFTLTNKGLELELKAQLGKELKFTRFGIGKGQLDSEVVAEMTSLIDEVLSRTITKLEKSTTKATLGFVLNNTTVSEGFYWRELGIFAEDPDTEEEVLFMYANAGDKADYIPAFSSTNMLEKYVDVDLLMSQTENVTAVIDSSLVFATYQDLERVKEEVDEELEDTLEDVNTSINTLKTDIAPKSFTIPTSAWTQATEGYTATITDTSVTTNDMVDVAIDNATYSIAVDAEVKGYVEEIAGGIKLYAGSVPTGAISGKYVVNRGVANG